MTPFRLRLVTALALLVTLICCVVILFVRPAAATEITLLQIALIGSLVGGGAQAVITMRRSVR